MVSQVGEFEIAGVVRFHTDDSITFAYGSFSFLSQADEWSVNRGTLTLRYSFEGVPAIYRMEVLEDLGENCYTVEGSPVGIVATQQYEMCKHAANCYSRGFDRSERRVLESYIGYYGRPPDTAGFDFWAETLDAAGGDLSEIIEAFGESEEFLSSFGGLSNEALIDNLYYQSFGRGADPIGLEFYLEELESGRRSLQTIALNVLDGAVGEDLEVLGYKQDVASMFVSELEARAQVWNDIGWSLLDDVVDRAGMDAACVTILDAIN